MQHFISRRRAVPRTAAAGLVLAAAFLGVHAFQALRQRSETEILVTQFHSDTKYGALGEGVAVQGEDVLLEAPAVLCCATGKVLLNRIICCCY